MAAMTWIEAFRVPERPPRSIRTLHGPAHLATPCWPTPYRHAWGRSAFEQEAAREPGLEATERWEHGRLQEVVDADRHAALTARWGAARTAGARLGPVTVPPVSWADRQRIARAASRGWLRPLVGAFAHVACKAAWVDRLDPESLAAFGDLGDAVLASRRRPRLAVLEELLAARGEAGGALFAELDAMDRALDVRDMGRSWIMSRVPDHCIALWPLRNLMRQAERNGVLFREMRFRDYEAQTPFAPEMPVVCLDAEIYGGGFEHDLFHRLAPVLVCEDPLQYEVGLLAIEAAGQAFNSLVLSSWHSGPPYEGHATWPGAELFEQLERAFGLPTLSQQLAAFRIVALVCHPDFDRDPVEAWLELVPDGADRWTIESMVARYRRYVRRDAMWLRGLKARYDTPVFQKWRSCMEDRLTDSVVAALGVLDRVVAGLEDVDLRGFDVALLGQVSESLQANRHRLLKLLELEHLVELANGQGAPLRARLDGLVGETRALDAALVALRTECRALHAVRPADRDAAALGSIETRLASIEARASSCSEELELLVVHIRERQRQGHVPAPVVPSDFTTTFAELFHRVYYEPPIHVGADLPGLM